MLGNTNPDVKYVRNAQVLGASLGPDEMALLSAAKGKYYGLNAPAKRIWQLLETPSTLGEIRETLMAEFEVDQEVCERQTRELMAELAAEGLITPANGA